MNKVRNLIAQGIQPSVSKSGNVVLRSGKSYATLAKGNVKTKAGDIYQKETNTDPRISIMPDAKPFKINRTEYIKTRQGDKKIAQF